VSSKGAVFGVVVSWISVFEGYDAVPTSEGVASATNRTVVILRWLCWAWISSSLH